MNFWSWFPWRNDSTEEELIELLRETPIFSGLSYSDYRKIKELCHESSYNPGERIFSAGDPSSALYIIDTGSVQLFKEISDDESVDITKVEEGDFFGELALSEGHNRTASAKAAEPAVLLGIFRQELQEFIRRDSGAGIQILMNIIEVMGNHVNFSNEKIESLQNTIRDLREKQEGEPSQNDE